MDALKKIDRKELQLQLVKSMLPCVAVRYIELMPNALTMK